MPLQDATFHIGTKQEEERGTKRDFFYASLSNYHSLYRILCKVSFFSWSDKAINKFKFIFGNNFEEDIFCGCQLPRVKHPIITIKL